MMSPADMHRGLALRCYLAASHLIPLVAKPVLQRRLKRGKEDPDRWQEKLGLQMASRPDGQMIWFHAVGLGEVLSLRGLIDRLGQLRPDLSFLVTSTTAASARVFAKNAPARTIHQFLPLDAPAYRRRFLDHFTPALCVWAEQDLWPGMVSDLAARDIPQAIVAARMNAKSHRAHRKAAGLFADLYGAMAMVTAQDEATAAHLTALGAQPRVTGSLKPAAPPLSCNAQELSEIQTSLAGRTVWAVAPAHPDDMALAQVAHARLRETDPAALLIIAPRFADAPCDIDAPRRSTGARPNADDPIWLFDTFGDLGLIYRLAQAALIGGTFSDIEGHNPWEAAALDCAVLHGARTANFATDYAQLAQAEAALLVRNDAEIIAALTSDDLGARAQKAKQATAVARAQTDALASDLSDLIGGAHAG